MQMFLFCAAGGIALLYIALRWMQANEQAKEEERRPLIDGINKIDKKLDNLKTTIDCMEYTLNQVEKEIREIRRG